MWTTGGQAPTLNYSAWSNCNRRYSFVQFINYDILSYTPIKHNRSGSDWRNMMAKIIQSQADHESDQI